MHLLLNILLICETTVCGLTYQPPQNSGIKRLPTDVQLAHVRDKRGPAALYDFGPILTVFKFMA